jgi:flavodoxin
MVAAYIRNHLTETYGDITLLDQQFTTVSDLTSHDLTIFVSSTWSEGSATPSTDALIQEVRQSNTPLTMSFINIGLGDRSYDESFCMAAHTLSSILIEKGAKQINKTYEFDGPPEDESIRKLLAWLDPLVKDTNPRSWARVTRS